MQSALTQAVRATAGLTFVAATVACVWELANGKAPVPHTGVLVGVWTAALLSMARPVLLLVYRREVRRLHRKRLHHHSTAGVPLEKDLSRQARRRQERFEELPSSSGPEGWVKARQVAIWTLVLLCSLTAATSSFGPPEPPGKQVAALHAAGARVSTATIAEKPRITTRHHDDEDDERIVTGYTADLVLSVHGGPGRLTAPHTYTPREPHTGQEVAVLWAADDLSLGGHVGERQELLRYAAGDWGDPVTDTVMQWVPWVLFVIGVLALGLPFSLIPYGKLLRRLAWSPLAQTAHAAAALVLAVGVTPDLAGCSASGTAAVCAALAPFVLPVTYFCTGGWALSRMPSVE
ncbi:hypothetical protein [Streptomyces sp. NPDC053079]|uniref:hypothetical protein n=1 Tax=Streptomyces sp. NPDC053079 TaxID=3365697 RepID=UPI0037D44777